MRLSIVVWVVLVLAVVQGWGFFSSRSGWFYDSFGRQRIFHGVNAVYKLPPWVPPTSGPFNTYDSMVERDMQLLASWGFNFIRLGTMWPGVMPTNASFVNSTYLDQIERIVNTAAKYGIVTLLDLHQDLMSPKFCGEGAPDFIVPNFEGLSSFPLPVHLPYRQDPQTGYPTWQDCGKLQFGEYYPTFAVGKAFQALYDNWNGFGDLMISFWGSVAARFANNPHVVGYELINEPYFGDIYDHPELLLSGETDKRYLLPLYDRCTSAIRAADKNHIIFFEPSVGDELSSGFNRTPGGDPNTAYSYHVYCLQPSNSDNRICQDVLEASFYIKRGDALRLGVAGMMTEFGAVDDDKLGVAWLDLQTRLCDENLQSWAYWQYKFFYDITTAGTSSESLFFVNGTVQTAKVRSLSRSYAQAIQGRITSMRFDPATEEFSVSYFADVGIGKPTEIVVSPFYYASGFNVTITPAGAATYVFSNPILRVFALEAAAVRVVVSRK